MNSIVAVRLTSVPSGIFGCATRRSRWSTASVGYGVSSTTNGNVDYEETSSSAGLLPPRVVQVAEDRTMTMRKEKEPRRMTLLWSLMGIRMWGSIRTGDRKNKTHMHQTQGSIRFRWVSLCLSLSCRPILFYLFGERAIPIAVQSPSNSRAPFLSISIKEHTTTKTGVTHNAT